MGVIPTIAPFLLPDALVALRTRYPKLMLSLREDITTNLLSRLEAGQLDLALIALPCATGNLLVEPLFDDELWIIGLKNDPQVQPRQIKVTPSISDRLMLLEEGHCLRDHALAACGTNPDHPHNKIETTSLMTLVQMVESGLGVGLIPEMALRSGLMDSPNLLSRPLAKPTLKRTIALVARPSTARQRDIKALAGILQAAGTTHKAHKSHARRTA